LKSLLKKLKLLSKRRIKKLNLLKNVTEALHLGVSCYIMSL
jgi:hypothetical protein